MPCCARFPPAGAELCCHDWSCESFAFVERKAPAPGGTGGCNGTDTGPCCIFKDDVDELVAGVAGTTTGVRAKLPSYPPPYP